jgi:hypothetical protein
MILGHEITLYSKTHEGKGRPSNHWSPTAAGAGTRERAERISIKPPTTDPTINPIGPGQPGRAYP